MDSDDRKISQLTQVTSLNDSDLFVVSIDVGTAPKTRAIKKSDVSTGGGGTPGGSDTQIQFNDAGAFGGDDGFTYDKTTGVVTIGDGTGAKTVIVNSGSGELGRIVFQNAGAQIGSIEVSKTSATPDIEKMVYALGASGYGAFALQRNPGDEQLADDQVTTFAVSGMSRFLITIAMNDETYCEAWCPYNSTIVILHNSGNFNAVAGGGTLSGTTGTDGKVNLRMNNGTLYIENRMGASRHYSLAIIGAST